MKILTTGSVIIVSIAIGVYDRRQGDDHKEHKDCQFESVHAGRRNVVSLWHSQSFHDQQTVHS